MGIFERIFGKKDKKDITSKDLKIALMGVRRERRKKQMQMRKLSAKKNELIDQIKSARRDGNDLEVDFLWEELNQYKIDAAYFKREARILNLEGIGLTRYLRGMERLEKKGDNEKIRALLEKVRISGLDDKLRGQEIDEAAYLDALNATMEEIGLEIEEVEDLGEDPEKEKFLAEIDAINAAEEAGEFEEAKKKEETLKETVSREEEEEKE
jgi:hypothetical protein